MSYPTTWLPNARTKIEIGALFHSNSHPETLQARSRDMSKGQVSLPAERKIVASDAARVGGQ